MPHFDRRRFLTHSAATGLALAGWSQARQAQSDELPGAALTSASESVTLGFMGVNERGLDLARSFAIQQGVEIAYVCDVDERAVSKCLATINDVRGKKLRTTPDGIGDFRRMLDDPAVDAIVIAAPDHWHGPATIMACAAGKHVYVEKPACHNPHEGELMVEAARKHHRVVQLGTQRRSMTAVIEAVAKLREGAIGRVLFARGWYNNSRPTIGHGKPAPAPAWLDYALWQGPAPRCDYRDNILHYNWHWFWHWGTGELGNNGIHALDVCRWGLGVDYPSRVTASGGIYRYADDQETPDTQLITFEFEAAKNGYKQALAWEGRNWHRRGFEGSMFGILFYGDRGSLLIEDGGYVISDPKGAEIARGTGEHSVSRHLRNFVNSVRGAEQPTAEIEEGVKSTLLCHLGNISYRVGRPIKLDPQSHQILEDREAQALWTREYAPGWEPKV